MCRKRVRLHIHTREKVEQQHNVNPEYLLKVISYEELVQLDLTTAYGCLFTSKYRSYFIVPEFTVFGF